ncbi:Beta-ketoacyl-ACP synthase II [Candidatus Hepatincolaceae symbiont of Richtersius coronifer]
MRRVVITGMGIVCPLGVGVDHVWKRLINSESGLSLISNFDTTDLPSKVAGQVPAGALETGGFTVEEWISEKATAKDLRRTSKFIIYAIAATRLAMQDFNLKDLSEEQKENFGVHIGAGIGGLQEIYEASILLHDGLYNKITPFFIPASLINLASGHISIEYSLKGPNMALATACATGTHSIGDAYRLIKYGEADFMVAGGSEASVNRVGTAGFSRLHALSSKFNDQPTKASRPWDKARDGFVIAEGSGIVILEELENAQKRGAKIYAEIVGYGMSGDAYHITAPCGSGNGSYRCMKKAIDSANISKEEIGYINAHGTSTPLGDMAEIGSIKKLFGDHAKNLSISSTKSAIGHLLGASGAVEAIFCVKALETGILPPTLNLDNPEEDCDLDMIPHVAKKKDIQYAMSNSFGFGGTNGTLILKKWSS